MRSYRQYRDRKSLPRINDDSSKYSAKDSTNGNKVKEGLEGSSSDNQKQNFCHAR